MRSRRSGTVLLAVVCAAALSAIGADAASRAPARMLVYAQEWSLWPSRTSLPAGKVVVQLWNRGQDAHDLRIRRLRGGHMTGAAHGVAVTESGGISAATWHLAPGHYELYCSMPGHLARGMHTTVIVR